MTKPRDIVCKLHGPAQVALACRHVVAGVACGFHPAPDDPQPPEAWCDRCDEALVNAGEWTLELTRNAEMTTVCNYCYDLAATRNQHVPKLARGARAILTGEEYHRLCEHALARIAELQEAARERWGFDSYARWDFDEGARTLAFTDATRPTVIADVRLVGAYDPTAETFRWAWDSHAAGNLVIAGVAGLRAFGEVRGITALTTAEAKVRRSDGWQLAAIAGYLLGCDGAYRAEFDGRQWFMLLANWRTARRGATEPGDQV